MAIPMMIDPRKWLKSAVPLQGSIPLNALPRLGLEAQSGEVLVALSISQQANGRYEVDGEISTAFELTCRRCLQPLSHAIHQKVHLVCVSSDEQASALPEEVDAWMMSDPTSLALHELIEEELLLAMPLSVQHDPDCREEPYAIREEEPEAEVQHPFSDLEALVREQKKG